MSGVMCLASQCRYLKYEGPLQLEGGTALILTVRFFRACDVIGQMGKHGGV
jgi:hypothetical protein